MTAGTYDLHALIEEARRRARQRRWAYAGVLALLAGAGIWSGLALTSGNGAIPAPPAPPGYRLVRARGTVQHVLVNGSFRGGLNGYPVGKAQRERLEVWFDRKTSLIRTRSRWGDGRVREETSRCACPSGPPESFFARYWPVDTTKFVRRPGIGTFHGREVIWLGKLQNTFPPGYRDGEWIALDPRTHDAVAWRLYGTTDKPVGQILAESWVTRRFPDIAPDRFWFALKTRVDVQFVAFEPFPLEVPGREPPSDLRHAARVVVGRLGRATIFAARRRDGSWRLFRVGKDGTVGGGGWRLSGPNTLRAGIDQGGHGGPFNGRAYLVVAGGMLAERDTKLFIVYADRSRRRIKLSSAGKAVGARFNYFVFPTANQVRGRRATALEVVRGSRLIANEPLALLSPLPKQPGPRALQAALRVSGF